MLVIGLILLILDACFGCFSFMDVYLHCMHVIYYREDVH